MPALAVIVGSDGGFVGAPILRRDLLRVDPAVLEVE